MTCGRHRRDAARLSSPNACAPWKGRARKIRTHSRGRAPSQQPSTLSPQPSTSPEGKPPAPPSTREVCIDRGSRAVPGTTPASGAERRAPAPRSRKDASRSRGPDEASAPAVEGDRAPRLPNLLCDRAKVSSWAPVRSSAGLSGWRTSGAPARRAYGSESPLVPTLGTGLRSLTSGLRPPIGTVFFAR